MNNLGFAIFELNFFWGSEISWGPNELGPKQVRAKMRQKANNSNVWVGTRQQEKFNFINFWPQCEKTTGDMQVRKILEDIIRKTGEMTNDFTLKVTLYCRIMVVLPFS